MPLTIKYALLFVSLISLVTHRPSPLSYTMQVIPRDKLLEHYPDTLLSVRKEHNLDKPGLMQDAVRILREWVEKQQHLVKKDFSDHYLETKIIGCKGSVERAKAQLDRMCTTRTLLPQFFKCCNVKTDLSELFDTTTCAVLPKLTEDHYRVIFVKFNEKSYLIKSYLNFYSYFIIISEYLKAHDYFRGVVIISDVTETNLTDILRVLNPVEFRQGLSTFIEAYGMRMKGMHIFSSSKLIDSIIGIMKQVTSDKIGGRIHSHRSFDDLPKIVPLDILPVEYGGKERPLKTICEEWIDTLSSEENVAYMKDMNEAATDESLRREDKFNEQCAGMPGTFRVLSVD